MSTTPITPSHPPTRVRVTSTTSPTFYLGRPRTIWLSAFSPTLRPRSGRS